MWEKIPCRICGGLPAVVNGRITHVQCIDELIRDALPRMKGGNEDFKKYLDASALLERGKIATHEEWCSSFPTLSEGLWVFLNTLPKRQ
jgi:hypothetical protein